jgi:hypothetical protein
MCSGRNEASEDAQTVSLRRHYPRRLHLEYENLIEEELGRIFHVVGKRDCRSASGRETISSTTYPEFIERSVVMSRIRIGLVLLAGLIASNSLAYGPKGHAMVGAIADRRLAGTPVAAKISALLEGMTLEHAALLPDQVKSADGHPDSFHVPGYPHIERDLVAFLKANPHGHGHSTASVPDHHTFHYTDVPVGGNSVYASGKVGRSTWDVVHVVPLCISVLKGQTPETNDRKITKRVAVILLAHYVGDLHQPLHVGAQYFGADSQPLNPDTSSGTAFGDNGGNNLNLTLDGLGVNHGAPKLHAYWDDNVVTTAMGLLAQEQQAAGMPNTFVAISDRLAQQEPTAWKLPADVGVENWARAWADEIMPIANEAHSRLQFDHIVLNQATKLVTSGQATERMPRPGGVSYHDYAGKVVRDELHKAGWRLAVLLEKIVE